MIGDPSYHAAIPLTCGNMVKGGRRAVEGGAGRRAGQVAGWRPSPSVCAIVSPGWLPSSPMAPEVTRTIIYRGKPPWHTALVQFLKEEGVLVEWSPPTEPEERGIGADVNDVVVYLVCTGTAAAIRYAVRKFRNFGPRSKGKVEVEGEPDDGSFLDKP